MELELGVCPSCEHNVPGAVSWWMKGIRRVLGLKPARPACPADDGMGGGIEYDGKCNCTHAYHG